MGNDDTKVDVECGENDSTNTAFDNMIGIMSVLISAEIHMIDLTLTLMRTRRGQDHGAITSLMSGA